jgi:SAM-dependent methyltransferase
MRQTPVDPAEISARIKDHVEELLRLWWAEQGGAIKDRELQIISSTLPPPRDRTRRAMDLGCGPGDLGRAIGRQFPDTHIDFVDRDPLLLAICREFNATLALAGTYRQLDLSDGSWCQDLPFYDVIAAANAIHWLSLDRAEAVLADVHRLLDAGGTFVFAEPVRPEVPFAPGFDEWKSRQPARYAVDDWKAFWNRANSLVGYDHTELLGSREEGRIGDGMTVRGWIDLVATSGFPTVDVLWRDADAVIIAARKA